MFNIEAKIDTGAYSSSIHCDDIHLHEGMVDFRLLDDSHPDYHDHPITLPVHKIATVKSSNGTTEERIFIKTDIALGHNRYSAILSLSDRASMAYPMLIGRTFLEGRFLVDVSLAKVGDA